MLSYLQNSTRPEISMATHQTARFSNSPMLSHEKSIMRIGRYLLDTRKRGIIYKPDVSKGLKCYVDTDFAGGWSQADSENADNVLSRTGYIIMYADCPILWVSRLQTEIALSTAKAEYIALSQSLRDVIPLITLIKEINTVFPVHVKTPIFVCKVHEDNQSCITMATTSKFSPRKSTLLSNIITFVLMLKMALFKLHTAGRLSRKRTSSLNPFRTIFSSNFVTCFADGRSLPSREGEVAGPDPRSRGSVTDA